MRGKRCTKCGEWKPLGEFHKHKRYKSGRRAQCKECVNERGRRYRKEHHDKVLEYQRQYREEHRDEIRIYQRRWREKHHEDILVRERQYREEHCDEIRACQRQYYIDHRDEILMYQQQYYVDNHGEKLAYQQRYYMENRDERLAYGRQHQSESNAQRRQRYAEDVEYRAHVAAQRHQRRVLLENSDTFTAKEWLALCDRSDWCCLACNLPHEESPLTVDHVVPLSKGGGNTIDNIQPLCQSCNSCKGTQTIDFREGKL